VPKGGTGCGLEVKNGVAYSIGSQFVDVSYADPCVDSVLLNAKKPPVFVSDGQQIVLSVFIKGCCKIISISGPMCSKNLFAVKFNPRTKKSTLVVNKTELKRRLAQQKKLRRKK
jgi:hypothetical protein